VYNMYGNERRVLADFAQQKAHARSSHYYYYRRRHC